MGQEQEEHDFKILLTKVGKWFDDRMDTNMLKVLYRDHIKETQKLERAKNTMQLFQYLKNNGKLSLKDPTILYDTIHITDSFELQEIVKKHTPDCPDIENEIEILTFSDHRQKIFRYGLNLPQNELDFISEYYLPGRYYTDSWEMIMDLEKRDELTEDKIDGFTEKFSVKQINQVHRLHDNVNPRSYDFWIIFSLVIIFLAIVMYFYTKQTTDDVIRNYLKERQMNECEKLKFITAPVLNDKTKPIDISNVYTDLKIVYVNETNTKPITLMNLMGKIRNFTSKPKVLITGKGGIIGKSTLLYYIAYMWAIGIDSTFEGKLLFLINIRDIQPSNNFVDAIIDESNLKYAEKSKNLPNGSIKLFLERHSDEIVLLLDGLDELRKGAKNPSELFTIYELKGYTVLLTSRPEYAGKLTYKCDIHVNVRGFNSRSVKIYIQNYFKFYKNESLGKSLIERLSSVKMKGTLCLCSSPHILLMVCTMWRENKSIPQNVPELYEKVFLTVLNQYRRDKEKGNNFSQLRTIPEEYEQAILTLGKYALKGLLTNNLFIDREEILELNTNEKIVNLAFDIGLVYIQDYTSDLDSRKIYTNPQKLILEALAGYYINIKSIKDPLSPDEYEKIRLNSFLAITKAFAIGFLGCNAFKLFQHWLKINTSNYYSIVENFINVEPTHRKDVLIGLDNNMSDEVKQHVESMTNSFRIFYGEKKEDKEAHLVEFIETFCDTVINDRKFKKYQFSKNMSKLIITSKQPCQQICRVISQISLMEKACKQYGFYVYSNDTYILQMIKKFGNEAIDVLSSEWQFHNLSSEVHKFGFNNYDLRLIEVVQFCQLIILAPNLKYLYIENCNLSAEYIHRLINCYNTADLRQIYISKNNLEGINETLFSESLKDVDEIHIEHCNITGTMIANMLNNWEENNVLKKKQISVRGNNLSNINVESLLQLMYLWNDFNYTEFKFSDYNLSKNNIHEILTLCKNTGKCKFNFTFIDLSNIDLFSIDRVTLANLANIFPNIHIFNMVNCNLTGTILSHILKHPEIRHTLLEIDLSYNNLGDINATVFSESLKNVNKMNIENCNITGTMIGNMLNLWDELDTINNKQISLRGNNLSNIDAKSLVKLINESLLNENICDFDLRFSDYNLSAKNFLDLLTFCYTNDCKFRSIYIDFSNTDLSLINGSTLVNIFNIFPNIEILFLNNCSLSATVVNNILKHKIVPRSLCAINLSYNNLRDINVTLFSESLKNINYILIKYCNLTGPMVGDMLTEWKQLDLLKDKRMALVGNDLSNINVESLATLIHLSDGYYTYFRWRDYNLSSNNIRDFLNHCNNYCKYKFSYIDLSNVDLSVVAGDTLANIFNIFPNLNALILANCSLTGTVVGDILKHQMAPLSLSKINLSHNNLKDIDVTLFCESLLNVDKIYMEHCNLTNTLANDMSYYWEELDVLKNKQLKLLGNE